MDSTAFDGDKILNEYLSDYLDGNLDDSEREVFEEYLDENQGEKEFTRKAMKGKQALNWMADKLNAWNNLEIEFAKRIALEKLKRSSKSDIIN